MKTPAEILKKTENGLPRPSWTSRTPTGNQVAEPRGEYNGQAGSQKAQIPQRTKTLVNMIFARFLAIYGHKFRSCFESQEELKLAKREWALSLVDYNEGQMVAAINACKEKCDWMPTISEFLREINNGPGMYGFPSVFEAYQEACRYGQYPRMHDWSHEVVYQAGRSVGWYELLGEPQSEMLPRFTYAFERACDAFKRGDTFEEPVSQALTNQSDVSAMTAILEWSHENNLSNEQGVALMFYQTKPVGSDIRARLYVKAQREAAALGIELPAMNATITL